MQVKLVNGVPREVKLTLGEIHDIVERAIKGNFYAATNNGNCPSIYDMDLSHNTKDKNVSFCLEFETEDQEYTEEFIEIDLRATRAESEKQKGSKK